MNGILLIDKEPGWTSNDVVVKLKGVLHERRIGHSGTLDPMATGLLVVFVGRATRAVPFAEHDSKRYLASLRLGVTTDTQDTTGNILQTRSVDMDEERLREILPRFLGEQTQIPPMYSAIRIKGRHLYDIARKGGEVERAPRPITIHELTLLGREGEDYLLNVRCSKGTYIRTLCHDLGQALGCGGCMAALRRTASGAFRVEDARKIGEITRADRDTLLAVDSLFPDAAAMALTPEQERRCRCGNAFETDRADGEYRFYAADGAFLALGRVENRRAVTIKSFFEVN